MRLTAVAFFFCLAVFAAHQPVPDMTHRTIKFNGLLETIDGRPISYATIEITSKNITHRAESDSYGKFTFIVPKDKFMLRVSVDGYCSRIAEFSPESDFRAVSKFPLMTCSDCPPMSIHFAEPNIGIDTTSAPIGADGTSTASVGEDRTPVTSVDYSKLPMKYEKELLPVSNSAEHQFSISYGKRTEQ
jgi:hypothetical protein